MADEEEHKAIFEEMTKCQSAFGQFVLDFSKAEFCLYLVLMAMTRLPDATARAVFSGVRAKAMSQYINTIIANTQPSGEANPKVKQLQRAMGQMNVIDGTRNQLVHGGLGSFTRDGMVVTNELRVSRYENFQTYVISSKELRDISIDLSHIASHFHVYTVSLIQTGFGGNAASAA
jgi:hypothetical protein